MAKLVYQSINVPRCSKFKLAQQNIDKPRRKEEGSASIEEY